MNDDLGKWYEILDRIRYKLSLEDTKPLATGAVLMLYLIHAYWVKHNTKKFFEDGREDKRFMFMPLWQIGWNEARKDLLFLKPILDNVDYRVTEEDIKNEYLRIVAVNEYPYDRLVDYIKNLEDNAFAGCSYFVPRPDQRIFEAMMDDETAHLIADQCIAAA